jgi:hypothetical protein
MPYKRGIPKDSTAWRRVFGRLVEERRAVGDKEGFSGNRRGWALGDKAFRKELTDQMTAKMGPEHCGEERRESRSVKAERIIQEEMRKLKEIDLETRSKGDSKKVRIAARLREGTTVTVEWITERLRMGSRSCAHNLVYAREKK